MPRPRGRRLRRLGLLVAVLVLVVVGAGAALQDSLVYYRTPGEVLDGQVATGQQVRVSGTVQPGSLVRDGATLQFVLRGDHRSLPVTSAVGVPATLREGEDAVVEGRLTADDSLVADNVLVRHSNEYRSG
ncbi:MAG: cytochrome c maturation protein CcmE [Actinomycetes bacterium]